MTPRETMPLATKRRTYPPLPLGEGVQRALTDHAARASEGDPHDVPSAEAAVAVWAFARAGGGALLDAFFAEDVAAGFDGGVFEVDAADGADGEGLWGEGVG